MRVTRRSFLKISGAVLAASGIGISIKPIAAYAKPLCERVDGSFLGMGA